MVKTRNPKSPDHKYFDVQKIGEIDALSTAAGLQDYVTAYASYVIFRAKAFTARYTVSSFCLFLGAYFFAACINWSEKMNCGS